MRRCAVVVVTAVLLGACGDTTAGRICQPGDASVCGEGFQCLTFCDKDASEPQSICTPSFGAEAGDTFDNQALIDGKVAFGELGNVRSFARDLRIELTGVKGVALPLLEEVQGNLTVVGTDVECLSMPRLTSVGGAFTIDHNGALVKTELEAVEDTHGLVVTGNGALQTLSMPALASVEGDLTITGNALESLAVPKLAAVSGCVDVKFDEGECTEPPALDESIAACCSGAPVLLSAVDGACASTCP